MITVTTKHRDTYSYEGATYYLEGLVGGIPYQQKQIARLREDLQIMKDETYFAYHSPSFSAWDDGVYQKNRYDDGHHRVIDMMEREEKLEAKIREIEQQIKPVMVWIETLDAEDAEIIKERYWKHHSLERIGATHCMSRETVRRLISRVLLSLENYLFTV